MISRFFNAHTEGVALWYTITTMENIKHPKSESMTGASSKELISLGFENVRAHETAHNQGETNKKELEDLQDKKSAAVLVSILPQVLDQNKEIGEKELRIGFGAFRTVKNTGASQRLWGISEGRPLSKKTIITSMKAAMIQAAMREALEVLGKAKVEMPKGEKPLPSNLGLTGFETYRVNLQEILESKVILKIDETEGRGMCVGYVNEVGGAFSVEGYDGDGYKKRRGADRNMIEGKEEVVELFTKEEKRDLVLLVQVISEKKLVSHNGDWKMFKPISDEAKYLFAVDAQSGVVSIKGDTEEEGDLEFAHAVARKREIGMMVDELYNQFSVSERVASGQKEKYDAQAKIAELERKNAELVAQLKASDMRTKALEEEKIKDDAWRRETADTARKLLGDASMFNSNKAGVFKKLAELFQGRRPK